ncbi:hypothetical protein ACJ4V0_14705 [Phreatobacter sp. HK31-P]
MALVAAVLPLLFIRMPTLWDYPNHLVRYWILLGHAEGTPVANMFRPDWSLARTNIGSDLLAVGIGSLISLEAVTPVLVGLAVLILPLGAIVLNRTIFGVWHVWQVALVALTWNFVLTGGLLSFQIALGLAMFGAALDLKLSHIPGVGRWLVRLAFASGILIVHVFGLLFYLVLLVGIDVGRRLPAIRLPQIRWLLARRVVLAGLACCIPLVVLVLTAPRLPGAHEQVADAQLFGTVLKFRSLFSLERLAIFLAPVRTYSVIADLATLFALVATPAYAAWRGRIELHAGLFGMGVLLLAMSHFVPETAFGTGLIDIRIPMMAGLLLAGSIRPRLAGTAEKERLVLAITLALVLMKAAFIGYTWMERQADIRSIDAATISMPAGAAVLVAENRPDNVTKWLRAPLGRYAVGVPIYRHLGATVVMSRLGFVPTIFTAAGKQPLEILPPWKDISVPEGGTPRVDDLDNPRMAEPDEYPYLRNWRARFDYVLLINADLPNAGMHAGEVPGLSLVSDKGFARLYRIDRQP